jgi:polysaccharide export outer membrane protein
MNDYGFQAVNPSLGDFVIPPHLPHVNHAQTYIRITNGRIGAPQMFRITAIILAVAAATLISACSSYRPVDVAFHEVLAQPYRLDSGDSMRITVFGQADLTNSYTVDKSGYIAFPLIGSVAARGLSPKELEAAIAQRLAAEFISDPDVVVEVVRYRPFFVMGEVNSGGQYTYVPGMTVQNAVAIAGGFTPRALQDNADVTRHVSGQILVGRVPLTDPILPGDTVYIRERLF